MQALSQYQTQRVVAFFFNDIRVIWCTVTPVKSIISHCNPDIHTRVSLSSVYVPADWIHSRLEIQVPFPALVFAVAYPREEAA